MPMGATPDPGPPMGSAIADQIAQHLAGLLGDEAKERAAAVYIARGVLTPRESQTPVAADVIDLAEYIVGPRREVKAISARHFRVTTDPTDEEGPS
jgi:hypothetical protein